MGNSQGSSVCPDADDDGRNRNRESPSRRCPGDPNVCQGRTEHAGAAGSDDVHLNDWPRERGRDKEGGGGAQARRTRQGLDTRGEHDDTVQGEELVVVGGWWLVVGGEY